jgi:hypothetical protein
LPTASAVALACFLAMLAGCGGSGGGDQSTTRTVAGHTITVPKIATTSTRSTGARPTTTVPSTITLPGGQEIQRSTLVPFGNCLRSHGVDPNAAPGGFGTLTQQRIAQQVRAFRACASQLPPLLKQRYEQYRRRLQQQHQAG